MKKFVRKTVEEDAPVNSAGGGNIAGIGVGAKGEPGVSRTVQIKHQKRASASLIPVSQIMRRPKPIMEEIKTGKFAGNKTFIVPEHVYEKAMYAKRKGKHWRTYVMDETFHPAIREFAYAEPDSPIIFENEKTGYMCYARYGKKRK